MTALPAARPPAPALSLGVPPVPVASAASIASPAGRPSRRRLLAVAAAAVLLLAACGDDDGDGAASGTSVGTSAGSTEGDGSGEAGPSGDAPVGPVPLEVLQAASGDAPAVAGGAGLDEPPGPADRTPLEGFGETAVAVTAPDGTLAGWCVLLALTSEQRQRGLMEVEDLGGYAGMLFVFDGDTDVGFYMRDTPMPLSIGWFDAGGDLVSTADMDPCGDVEDCPTTAPDGDYRFALEVPQGGLTDVGVVDGSRLAAGGDCAPPTGAP